MFITLNHFIQTKSILGTEKKNLSREIIVTINRLRANHYSLAASLARLDLVENSNCLCGEGEQDINHVLLQCKLFNPQRDKFMKRLKNCDLNFPLNIDIIIQKPNNYVITCLYDFLKSCNLKV